MLLHFEMHLLCRDSRDFTLRQSVHVDVVPVNSWRSDRRLVLQTCSLEALESFYGVTLSPNCLALATVSNHVSLHVHFVWFKFRVLLYSSSVGRSCGGVRKSSHELLVLELYEERNNPPCCLISILRLCVLRTEVVEVEVQMSTLGFTRL